MPRIIEICRSISNTPIYRYTNTLEMQDGGKKLVSIPVVDKAGNHVMSPLGLELVAVMLHLDEGNWEYPDGRSAGLKKGKGGEWCDANGTIHDPKKENLVWKKHAHVHPWYNMVDPRTGKVIKIAAEELSQIQDLVANKTGLERGVVGSNTRHLHPDDWTEMKIIKAQLDTCLQEIENISAKKEAGEVELKVLQDNITSAQDKLEKMATNPLARLGASIHTKLSGNRTQQEFDAAVAAVQEACDAAIAETKKDCEEKIEAARLSAEMSISKAEDERRKASSEAEKMRLSREEDRKTWGQQAYDLALEVIRKKFQADLDSAAEREASLKTSSEKLKKELAAPSAAFNALLRTLNDYVHVKNEKRFDFLALLVDHVPQEDMDTFVNGLKAAGIKIPIRNSAQLSASREKTAMKKPVSHGVTHGLK